jgi:hypothetical protein
MGTVNVAALLPDEYLDRLDAKGVKSIDDFANEDLYWFMVNDVSFRRTKKNKPYALISVLGTSGQKHRIFVWNTPENAAINEYSVAAAQLQCGDFGFSTRWNKLISLS